jgi:hypothetical protein
VVLVEELHQKTCSSSGVVAVILYGHYLGPTSRAGTVQPDAGLNPHSAAWPESLKETKHNPFTLGGIISTGPKQRMEIWKARNQRNECECADFIEEELKMSEPEAKVLEVQMQQVQTMADSETVTPVRRNRNSTL